METCYTAGRWRTSSQTPYQQTLPLQFLFLPLNECPFGRHDAFTVTSPNLSSGLSQLSPDSLVNINVKGSCCWLHDAVCIRESSLFHVVSQWEMMRAEKCEDAKLLLTIADTSGHVFNVSKDFPATVGGSDGPKYSPTSKRSESHYFFIISTFLFLCTCLVLFPYYLEDGSIAPLRNIATFPLHEHQTINFIRTLLLWLSQSFMQMTFICLCSFVSCVLVEHGVIFCVVCV
jgi:hypothetical protein